MYKGTVNTAPKRTSALLLHLAVLALYTLLTVIVTWPLAAHFSTGLVGQVGGVDAYLHAWNMWWIARALGQGQLPFVSPLQYYPQGVDLFWQTLGFSQGVAAMPVTLLFGPVAGLNFTSFAGFVLSGYITFLFARHVTSNTPGALIAGAVYAFSPYHLAKTYDGNIVAAIQWIPCYIFALHLLLERPRWWKGLLVGGLLLWVSLGSWYYGLFCLLYTGCVAGIWTISGFVESQKARKLEDQTTRSPESQSSNSGSSGFLAFWLSHLREALWCAVPILVWGLVLAPRIASLSRNGDQQLWDMREVAAEHSADLMDFFLPNPHNPLWGDAVTAFRFTLYPTAIIWHVSLGFVGLALGLLGFIAYRRESWRWGALLLACLLLALGPALNVFGHATHIPMPYALIQDLPGVRAGHRPNHIVVIATLLLGILAAYGYKRLSLGRSMRIQWGGALVLVAVLVLVDGYAGPLHIVERQSHPFYAVARDRAGALMPLPLYININRSENLTDQMTHQHPIIGGYVARPPLYDFAAITPGLRELQYGEVQPDDIVSPGWPESGRRALAAYGIGTITLNLSDEKADYFTLVHQRLAELQPERLYVDDRLEAYGIPASWPVAPLGFLGVEWQPVEHDATYHWRWMSEQGELRLYNPGQSPVMAQISLAAISYHNGRDVQVWLDGTKAGSFTVSSSDITRRQIQFLLPPGEHKVLLTAIAEPDPARKGKPISIRVFSIDFAFTPLASAGVTK